MSSPSSASSEIIERKEADASAGSTAGSSVKKSNKRWHKEEDALLKSLVESYVANGGDEADEGLWLDISNSMPGRDPSHCMNRWKTMLDPNLVKGAWSKEVSSPSLSVCLSVSLSLSLSPFCLSRSVWGGGGGALQ